MEFENIWGMDSESNYCIEEERFTKRGRFLDLMKERDSMREKRKSLLKKVSLGIVCVATIAGTMGMTAFAASGYVYGYMTGNQGTATCVNTSGYNTYCEVFLLESNNINTRSTVNQSTGVVASGDGVTTSGPVNCTYAWAKGLVYNSGSPNSGVGWAQEVRIK